MRVELHNVGCIKDADIRLNGITVLTGYNSTGKSTVLKTVYALLSSQHDVRKRVMEDIEERVALAQRFYSLSDEDDGSSDTLQRLSAVLSKNESNKELPASFLKELALMKDYLEGKTRTSVFSKRYLVDCVEQEFGGQMFTLGSEGGFARITLDDGTLISVDAGGGTSVVDEAMVSSVSYVDTPLVLDQDIVFAISYRSSDFNHRSDLTDKLFYGGKTDVFGSIVSEESVSKLDSTVSKALSGTLRRTKKSLVYDSEEVKGVKASNLASGMKVFAIIRILMDNGYLKEGDVLLIDEPEIHLHPEWQLILAELLASMNKELGIRLLITTHSPQFLLSLEAFSAKLDVDMDFYEASVDFPHVFIDNGKNLSPVYRKMADAMQKADTLRDGYDRVE